MKLFPYIEYYMINPIFLFFFFCLLEMIRNIKHKPWFSNLKNRIKIYWLIMIIVIAYNIVMLSNYDSRKSPVDPTPLSKITEEQILYIEDVIKCFEEFDFITRFYYKEYDNEKMYTFTWTNNKPDMSLRIYVHVFNERYDALNKFRNESSHLIGPSTYAFNRSYKYPNGIEVVLFNSFLDWGHFVPSSYRYLYSNFNIGNIVILLEEIPERQHLQRSISKDFVILFCKLLEEFERGD